MAALLTTLWLQVAVKVELTAVAVAAQVDLEQDP